MSHHDIAPKEVHKRLLAIECRTDQFPAIRHENEKLRTALAEMCKGQQYQDEVICALQRRVQELEAERALRHEISKFGRNTVEGNA